MNVAKKLKEIRIINNLTQEELAEKIHVSRQTISNWENERSYPDILSIIFLSEIYNTPVDIILKGDDEMFGNFKKEVNSSRKLYIRERGLYKSRSFNIVDGLGKTKYETGEVGILMTPKFYHVKDSDGNLICKITRKRVMYYNLPRFILKIKGFKKLSLIIDMEPFRKIFKINGEGLFIKGE